ncbi:MAG: universal stress protein [Rhizobiaceae bacterium]
MSYKTILLCLTSPNQADRLTTLGCMLARRFGAHLVGLHTLQNIEVYPGVAIDLPRQATLAFNEEQACRAEKTKQIFQKHTEREDCVSEWRLDRSHSVRAEELVVQHALCADLVILPQGDIDQGESDAANFIREVIKNCGRPVLVIPSLGAFNTIGTHSLVGWSATREASRAVSDAIPFLSGNQATLLWVSSGKDNAAYMETTADQIAICLDRHGVDSTVAHWQNAQISIGDVLLNEAFERGADLIVTGALGHSQFYDFVIGAVTSHLIEHMTMPVLFSH